ncbi:MAG: DUF255 domain-containing protein [Bacteroidetes bacterium]|nr:DUF255 domain-containing protein [Bacteroidota bacterium]MBU1717562.1 DUF255 domain-containing protein [Bacteroidota bacterium]
MKRTVFAIAIAALTFTAFTHKADKPTEGKINWMSIQDAEKAMKDNPKKIIIDCYTDWCGWCKVMDSKTFTDPWIVSYINENFYAVKFNAETRDEIEFNGKKYSNANPAGKKGGHQLAYLWLKGRLGYPSFSFLDEKLEIITTVAGYHKPNQFEPVLKYVATDAYEDETYDSFAKNFKGTLPAE